VDAPVDDAAEGLRLMRWSGKAGTGGDVGLDWISLDHKCERLIVEFCISHFLAALCNFVHNLCKQHGYASIRVWTWQPAGFHVRFTGLGLNHFGDKSFASIRLPFLL
jgi:hypothetical protein